MKYEISDTLYKQIQDITGTDYDRIGKDIPVESIESIIEDLIYEIHNRDEKIEDIKNDIQDNYKKNKCIITGWRKRMGKPNKYVKKG